MEYPSGVYGCSRPPNGTLRSEVALHAVTHALSIAGSMTWELIWALILGFLLSAIVQALVRKSTIVRWLGDDRLRTLTLASALGAADGLAVHRGGVRRRTGDDPGAGAAVPAAAA
jgi:uncharacterized membrane protein YraQ (UPF0718 family)